MTDPEPRLFMTDSAMPSDGGVRLFQMAFKYRLYPTDEQARYFWQTIGSCRWVYNHFLQLRIEAYERTQKTLRRPVLGEDGKPVHDAKDRVVFHEVVNESYDPKAKPLSFYDTSRMLTRLKKEVVDESGHAWLCDADATALVYALRNLDRAYQNFFRSVKKGDKQAGFPKFKHRSSRGSFKTAFKNAAHVRGGRKDGAVKLPKVGEVRATVHRPLLGTPISATVSVDSAGRWFCSVQCKDVRIDAADPLPDMVGVTTGIAQWAVTSDGKVYENPRRYDKIAKRLARAQRMLSRKVGAKKGEKPSKNYIKQQKKVARLNARLADQRSHDTHALTRDLVDSHGAIAIREMRVKDMQARGAGLKGKARKDLNRRLADANLAEVQRQLAYKCEWAGRELVVVPADYPTAQVCSACGHKNTVLACDMRAVWTCPACGRTHQRKLNGAENVLAAARDIMAGAPLHGVSKAREAARGSRDERRG